MLTKLLMPPEAAGNRHASTDLVEEIGQTDSSSTADDVGNHVVESEQHPEGNHNEEEFDWYIEQNVLCDEECTLVGNPKYGFALQKSGLSGKLLAEFGELIDISDPDSISSSDKRQQRLALEEQHFCGEHYLADKYNNDEINEILKYRPWWTESIADCKLTKEAVDLILKLPKKKYIYNKELLPVIFFSLVDIIFAYAYNHRTLNGENNVMSGWTIAKLAPTMSWLDTFTSLHNVIVSSFRRALTYPLYRNWDLCLKVLVDVQTLFAGGKKPLLKCLLDTYNCMVVSDPYYVFNDLYITDYCVWIQSVKSSRISALAGALQKIEVRKSDVGLELEELEFAAGLVLKEQGVVSGAGDRLDRIGLENTRIVLDSDDDSEDEEENGKDGNTRDHSIETVASKLQALGLNDSKCASPGKTKKDIQVESEKKEDSSSATETDDLSESEDEDSSESSDEDSSESEDEYLSESKDKPEVEKSEVKVSDSAAK